MLSVALKLLGFVYDITVQKVFIFLKRLQFRQVRNDKKLIVAGSYVATNGSSNSCCYFSKISNIFSFSFHVFFSLKLLLQFNKLLLFLKLVVKLWDLSLTVFRKFKVKQNKLNVFVFQWDFAQSPCLLVQIERQETRSTLQHPDEKRITAFWCTWPRDPLREVTWELARVAWVNGKVLHRRGCHKTTTTRVQGWGYFAASSCIFPDDFPFSPSPRGASDPGPINRLLRRWGTRTVPIFIRNLDYCGKRVVPAAKARLVQRENWGFFGDAMKLERTREEV